MRKTRFLALALAALAATSRVPTEAVQPTDAAGTDRPAVVVVAGIATSP